MAVETIQIETNRYRHYAEWENIKMDETVVLRFLELLKTLPVYQYNTSASPRLVFYDGTSWERYTIEKIQGEALLKLGEAITIGLQRMYEKGKNDGRNLLVALNNNEVTPKEFLK